MRKNKPKILIVDDLKSICQVIGFYLEEKGYEVFTANTAQEAISIIKKERLLVLLLDKNMPDKMSGIELLRQIRAFNAEIRVILMSGDVLDEATKREIKDLNVLDYLSKPIDSVRLNEVLKKALLQS
jgi:CheY-like chemotaxis protein